MLFNQAIRQWRLFILLPFAVAACATTTPEKGARSQPAVIGENESCHDAIQAVMKKMTGSERIRLSADVFRTKPMMLLSNYNPSELKREGSHQFSEAADKRFLLHMKNGRCFLSLMGEEDLLTATEQLDACTCSTVP